jgi:hypothetical protein
MFRTKTWQGGEVEGFTPVMASLSAHKAHADTFSQQLVED